MNAKGFKLDATNGAQLEIGGAGNAYGKISVLGVYGTENGSWDCDRLYTRMVNLGTNGAYDLSYSGYIQKSAYAMTNRNDDTTGTYLNAYIQAYSDNILVIQGIQYANNNYAVDFGRLGDANRYLTIRNLQVKTYANFTVTSGYTKSKSEETDGYGERLLYCYEMASPIFGDMGEGVIGDDGTSYVFIDAIFSETIDLDQYQVFLQAYGDGKCYVQERKKTHFVVAGEPGLKFGWEIKARQVDVSERRLERYSEQAMGSDTVLEYGVPAAEYVEQLRNSRL
jgi:hypothetical protein